MPVFVKMFLRWLCSATFRRARDMHKQLRKALNAQRDLLTQQEMDTIQEAKAELRHALRSGATKAELLKEMDRVEEIANQRLKGHSHPSIRENVEVVLVAVAVALAVRTFFLQPFKIPTGSMQPTLYGVTRENLKDDEDARVPTGWRRFYESWVLGQSYYHIEARESGTLNGPKPPRTIFPFVRKQELHVGDETYSIWFPPDTLNMQRPLRNMPVAKMDEYYRRYYGIHRRHFRKGEPVVKMRVTSGDYLFVNRFTYNFRHPKRGEIIVFETKGIDGLNQNQFYIKRLVALGGEKVRIGNDRHVYIQKTGESEWTRLDRNTPGFDKVYGFDPNEPPRSDAYSGHVNGVIAAKYSRKYQVDSDIAQLFTYPDEVQQTPEKHYMAMGDNTMDSKDSRNWGAFPRHNVIGKFCFVYWPFSERWGW